MEQTAANLLPGEQSTRVLPDLPASPTEQNETDPGTAFDHGRRLADKLIDAVEFNLDAAIRKAGNPDSVTQPVSANSASYLPPYMQTLFERNRIWFFGLLIAAMVIAFGSFLRR